MAGLGDVASVGYVAPLVSQKPPVLTLEACYNVKELKRGRYSVISHGDCDVAGAPVVIKTYDRPSLVPKKQKMATREAIVLKYLKSQGVPNITHVWSAYASQDRFHIIMEYCQGGNLLERLKAVAVPIPEQQLAATIAAPLLRTLAAMHAAGVTHRDIKLENIFLDCQGRPKLGDFDLAVFHHEAPPRAPVGTIFYMAPEVLLLAGYKGSPLEGVMQCRVSEKMDVWSLGVCLFELAAGYKPFQGVSYEGIASAVLQHAMADLPTHLSPAFKSFMSAALTYDPTQRPSAMQLVDHPWIQAHCPSAFRSDSAGSLTLFNSSSSSKYMKQQQQQGLCCSTHPTTGNQQQQQQGSSGGGCSSGGICEPLTPSSCSGSSITGGSSGGSSSSALKCSRDLQYGPGSGALPVAAVAATAAGGVALQHAVWQPPVGQMYYDGGVQQQQQHSVLAPMAAHAALPGLRGRNSLGTAHDWSTQDSSIACSPRSMLQRMGFSSSSGALARQLMPWASERSSALGLGYNYNLTNNSVTNNNMTTNITNQLNPSGSGSVGLYGWNSFSENGTVGCVAPGTQQQQQHDLGKRLGSSSNSGMLSPCDADGQPPVPAATNRHMRSSSAGSSSSSTGAINPPAAAQQPQQQQQQQQVAASSSSRSVCSNNSRSAPNKTLAAAEAAATAAAATAASGSQHLSPLALAVAAAVAEHNKRQPRMWTPFALRVQQMRVAQVLLAERQRQVALNQPNPPPPVQPLIPQQGEAVRLPDQDAAAAAGEQRQQQQHAGGFRSQEDPGPSGQQQQAAAAAGGGGVQDPRDPASEAQQQQQQQQPALRASSPAGADAAMIRPLVHRMQQQLSMASQAAASSSSSGAGSGRNGGSSGSSQKPPKQPTKKGFLSCFVPRAFE